MSPDDIVSLTELGQTAAELRQARRRWRMMVAYLKAAAAYAAALKAEEHAVLERERARHARQDRSGYLQRRKEERALRRSRGLSAAPRARNEGRARPGGAWK